MLFGRKNLFSATDAFPLTDAVLEFDDSSSVAVRPGRRALDGFGPRGERSASSKWWAVAGLIGLYAVALTGFYALGVVGAQVLWVLAGLTAAGFAMFDAVFRSGLQRKLRLRHLKLGIVTTAIGGMLVVLAVVDWRLAIGAAVYVSLSAAMVVRSRHRAVGESSDEMGSYARLYGGIEERLTAAEDLRANGAATHAMWRFVEESTDAMASSVRRERAFLRMWWLVQGAVAGGSTISLVVGTALVSSDVITVGTAFLLFQYVLLLGRPLEDVVDQLETVQKANGAMVRVIDLLAVRPAIDDGGTSSPPAGPLAVAFHHVSFDYGDGQPVLSDIVLEVAPGRSVGVVGRTGSGKTTLSRLLLRLVDTSEGTVELGGVAIREIPRSELRRRVAMIPQEVELFSGTVRDNVTLFDTTPSDDAVAHALRRAGLDSLVDGGIHRELGAGGAGLSAGEAQLLALARVWLRDPDLLVLDEATARVDPVTEARLEAGIAELMQGRTTFVIAHRLSTLRHVDEIVVVDHGRVVEHGDRSVLTADDDSRFSRLLALALDIDAAGADAALVDATLVDAPDEVVS